MQNAGKGVHDGLQINQMPPQNPPRLGLHTAELHLHWVFGTRVELDWLSNIRDK